MAIQTSDYTNFGNGIIGNDTFDIWRKKTNSLKIDIDTLNTTLTDRIDTELVGLGDAYIPKAGTATAVSTALSFSAQTTFSNNISFNGGILSGSSSKITSTPEFESSTQITSTKVRAKNHLILGEQSYAVPQPPVGSNRVLVGDTSGILTWENPKDVFGDAGGLQQTTTVFEEVMPVGSVVALAGDPIGDDFLYCNGADVPGGKSGQYGEGHLFDVIGYDYGGSGENFKLPDFRGRVPVGVEGNPVFSNVIGTRGGTDNTSTNGSALAINQIPAHRHKFIDNEGHSYFAFNDQNRGPDGDLAGTRGDDTSRMQEMGSTSTTFPDSIINHTTYTGGGANGGIHGGTTAADDLSSLSGTTPHSHAITAANRAQPYITVKWFIKAKKNSKLDFTIQVGSDSALEAVDTTKTGNARFISDIKPIDGTVTLRSKIDGSSIVVENNQLRIAENPIIRNNTDIGGRIIARNGVGSHLTGDDRLGNGSDHQIFGRIRVGFRGNEANNNNPPTYDQAIAYVGGDRVGTSDRLILAANDQVWLSVGAISHIHGGDSGTPTGTNSFRSQNNAGFRLINVNEMVNGTNTALYAYATLPRTRNSDINTGGAKSIITKQYLEDVFDLTDGVLTINLDPGDPT